MRTYALNIREGIKTLDKMAAGDFTTLSAYKMDEILAQDPAGFMSLMFGHTIEAMYSAPEYGGNGDLVGWHEISWQGDRQPIGYSDKEVSQSDGPDVYVPTGVGKQLLALLRTSGL